MMVKKRTRDEEAHCQSSKRAKTGVKSVKWAKDSKTYSYSKFDPSEKNDIWYSGADFQRFHLERLLTVQVYQQVTAGDKTPLNTDIVCFRGFEAFRTRESTKSFQHGRIAHTLNIVQEHTLQRLLSINNPERLRQLSMSRSNQDLLQAQTRAAFDEIEAYPASCLQRGQVLSSFPLDPGASVKSLFANELLLLKDSIGKEMFTPKAVVRAA